MNKVKFILSAAAIGFAITLTLSCSSDDGDGGGDGGGGGCGTVKIDTQVWQKCNSNVEPSSGISICYNNDPDNCTKYGKLYDWEAAMSACPSGFHLPTDEEWNILVNYAGGRVAGGKLKAKNGWSNDYLGKPGNGTDDFGFSALPGGLGEDLGSFRNFSMVGMQGFWWSATESGASNAGSRYMHSSDAYVSDGLYNKSRLYSVRCIQN